MGNEKFIGDGVESLASALRAVSHAQSRWSALREAIKAELKGGTNQNVNGLSKFTTLMTEHEVKLSWNFTSDPEAEVTAEVRVLLVGKSLIVRAYVADHLIYEEVAHDLSQRVSFADQNPNRDALLAIHNHVGRSMGKIANMIETGAL